MQALEGDARFDVSISGNGSPDQTADFDGWRDATLTLKNGDAEAYPVDWSFQIDGQTLQSGELELAPHGSSNIDVMPTSDLFSWTDAVRPSRRTGLLMLAVHGPPTVAKEILPARTLPVSLTMMKLSPAWTSFWSHTFVTLILLLGGLLSLIGNSVLPNILRKISIRRQIERSYRPGKQRKHARGFISANASEAGAQENPSSVERGMGFFAVISRNAGPGFGGHRPIEQAIEGGRAPG